MTIGIDRPAKPEAVTPVSNGFVAPTATDPAERYAQLKNALFAYERDPDMDRGVMRVRERQLTPEQSAQLSPYEKAYYKYIREQNDGYIGNNDHTGKGRVLPIIYNILKDTKDLEGAKKYMDVEGITKLASELKQQAGLTGIDWNNKGANAGQHFFTLAAGLRDQGISSIKSMRKEAGGWYATGADGQKKQVNINGDVAGATAYGNGWTDYKVQADSQGRPIFYPGWKSSSDAGKIAGVAGLALNILAPGAGSALGGALGLSGAAASAVGGGLIGGGLAAAGGASGSNILKSALAGGVAPAVTALPGISTLSPALKKVIAGATSGAIKNGSSGALAGALTGGIPGNITGVNPVLDRLLKAVIGQKISQKVAGKP